jgi:hypothetical protein
MVNPPAGAALNPQGTISRGGLYELESPDAVSRWQQWAGSLPGMGAPGGGQLDPSLGSPEDFYLATGMTPEEYSGQPQGGDVGAYAGGEEEFYGGGGEY